MSDTILRLTWKQTGDYFDISAENPDFGLWFVEQSQSLGYSYHYDGASPDIGKLISQLEANIKQVNPYLSKLKIPEIPLIDDMYDQHNLNMVHKSWIKTLRQEPQFDLLLHHVDPILQKKFHDVNSLVHAIENSFNNLFDESSKRSFQNKFKHLSPPVGNFNVSLDYCDWGKNSWQKFTDGAESPNDYELSHWRMIGQYIRIDLNKPYKYEVPAQYKDYCAKHKIRCDVPQWPLGNLIDYKETMPMARNIMNRNLQIADNGLTLSMA